MRRLAVLPLAVALTGALAANVVARTSADSHPSAAPIVATGLAGERGAAPAKTTTPTLPTVGTGGRTDQAVSIGLTPATPSGVRPSGIPSGAPEAAHHAEPALPVPAGWPFTDAFPRTSGTSRLVPGAFEYSDFLYDDHGALAPPREFPIAGLAPTDGAFIYSSGTAKKNGADIFRVGIGKDAAASYWRVDWNTLADPNVPIASFAIDSVPSAGVAAWPGIPNLKATGIDQALVVSNKGAWLLDSAGAATPVGNIGGSLTVDTAARSFVVRIPDAGLPTSGEWTVRLATGQADAEGDGLLPVDSDHGALPNQPPVFNVGFRSHTQESDGRIQNFWMEDAQAQALALGDVSQFAGTVKWSELAGGTTTVEPLPTGYTNRWYVSTIELGDGVVADSGGGTGDLKPNFLGRVQPYAVYVPSGYDANVPTPLTWILHSLSVQHNQYGAVNPTFIQQACEDRHSICATTLGRGPDGWYFDEAELDFWEVWGRLDAAYTLQADRTVLSGYSMGGWATYKLGLAHPDLFAKAVVLAGPPGCGLRVLDGYGGAGGPGRCTTDGNSTPFIENARWLPYYMAHGTDDELVPITSAVQHIDHFRDLGYRYRFELYPGQDHMAYAVEDHFASAAEHMGSGTREQAPDHVTYKWYPNIDRPEWGMTTTGAYWVRNPVALAGAPGTFARVDAVSSARPYAVHTPVFTPGTNVPFDPTPAVVTEQTWDLGAAPAAEQVLSLDLSNVSEVTIDLAGAGFAPGADGVLELRTNHAVRVVLRTSTGDVGIVFPANADTSAPFTA
jgi:hypothetical protein